MMTDLTDLKKIIESGKEDMCQLEKLLSIMEQYRAKINEYREHEKNEQWQRFLRSAIDNLDNNLKDIKEVMMRIEHNRHIIFDYIKDIEFIEAEHYPHSPIIKILP